MEGEGHKKEGAFCVWTQQEIDSLLHEAVPTDPARTLAQLFSYHYGVQPHGNVDPSKVRGVAYGGHNEVGGA